MVIHSSFADFVLFLYIHVAHIDNSYDPTELSTIKGKIKGLFPEETDVERRLYQAIRQYNTFDRDKLTELCRDTLAFFEADKATGKSRLFEDIRAIIEADGQVHQLETEAFQKIRQLIDEVES